MTVIAKKKGVALLEMLLVLTLLSGGLTAMLKIYAHNERIWHRLISTYCAYLQDSEREARESLVVTGVPADWNENWLSSCQTT